MADRKITSAVCEEEVFNELFKTHSKDLYNFLYYKYGEDNNPSDIVQDSFVKLWNNCHKVVLDKVRGFLFTVANNQMLSSLSRKKTALKYAENPVVSVNFENPEFLMEEQEYMDQLQNAIASLTEEQRVTFLLNRIDGKKHQEIAEMLGISRKAVEKRIYTALAKIREQLENFN